jgi:hypothetical protein
MAATVMATMVAAAVAPTCVNKPTLRLFHPAAAAAIICRIIIISNSSFIIIYIRIIIIIIIVSLATWMLPVRALTC